MKLATLLLLAGALPAQVVKTIVSNGPTQNRYDIVILGDGYVTSEQAKFDADALAAITTLFAKPAYAAYRTYFNVHTVFRASNESGADHPDANPPVFRDTVYDATYNYGGTARCLYIQNTSQALNDSRLAPDVEGRVVVLVNDLRYGGCGGTYSVSYTGSLGAEVQAHEFGHSFGALADEYDYGTGTYSGPEPGQANITADATGMRKWPLWLGSGGVSTFEGAGYYRFGMWRPEADCLMRSLSVPLCEVCNEQLVKQAYLTVDPIESESPLPGTVTVARPSSQTFTFQDLVPSGAQITWALDGQTVQSGGTSYVLDASGLSSGRYVLTLTVKDLTSLVRNDPTQLLTSSRSWTVNVTSQQPGTWQPFGIGCVGSLRVVPLIGSQGVPEVGARYDVTLWFAKQNASAGLLVGSSNTSWSGLPLPFDLGPFGAPACWVRASGDVVLPATVDSTSKASVRVTLPNDSALFGAVFYSQWAVFDAGANQLGLAWSAGAVGTVGRA